jgi:KipI family sensor histidine kinase inhibitor
MDRASRPRDGAAGQAEGPLSLIPTRGPHPFLRRMLPTLPRRVETARRHRQTVRVEFTVVGRRAVLVDVDDPAAAVSLALWARSARVPAGEIVPAARTVLFDDVADAAALEGLLSGWTPDAAPAGDLVEIPVVYDGQDLADVAVRWGTDVGGVVDRHAGIEYVVAFCGFSPGFAYLAGLPDELAVPRLDSPRTEVPAGAVGLAGTWCAAYPTASPGGWRLIGRTDAPLWDPGRDHPALLAPGTRVRFRPA